MIVRRFIAAVLGVPALLAGAVLATTGCTTFSETASTTAASCKAPDGVALVVGAHRNVPVPSLDELSPSLQCKIHEAIRAERPVRLVLAGGHHQVITTKFKSVSSGTLAEKGSAWVEGNEKHLKAEVASARPDAPGVNDLEALAVAVDAMRSTGAKHSELVLLDSGLSDRGAMNFTVPGMLAADPSEVTAALRDSGSLPDLSGSTVSLVGIGYTAPPQKPLDEIWRTSVTDIWEAAVRAAGAKVESVPRPAQGPAVRSAQAVKVVPVPADDPVTPSSGRTIVFRGNSPVRFRPDSLAFVEHKAAMRALEPTAQWLAADPSRRALLVGTTANVGSLARQVRFGGQRADRVAAMLIKLGVSAEQLQTKGVGSDFPQYRPDHDAAGHLLPGPATLNRSVRVSLTCPHCEQQPQ